MLYCVSYTYGTNGFVFILMLATLLYSIVVYHTRSVVT